MCADFVHPVEDMHSGSPSYTTGLLGSSSMATSQLAAMQPPPQICLQENENVGGSGNLKAQELNETSSISQKLGALEDDHKNLSHTHFLDEEDICPTCLDGYDLENPKINTACGHHFHLGCILEWAERRPTCPVCDKDMVFDESKV